MLALNRIYISLCTIVCNRSQLGWTYRGFTYYQLVRDVNKQKYLEYTTTHSTWQFRWCYLERQNNSSIWNPSMLMLQKGRRETMLKAQPKHPVKVHICTGISYWGATQTCIFKGTMDAPLFCNILEQALLSFIQARFIHLTDIVSCKTTTLNTLCAAQQFYTDNGVNWWRTPQVYPIVNLWHELMEYMRCEVKPRNKEQLMSGNNQFWTTVSVHKCCRYIGHLQKSSSKSHWEGQWCNWLLDFYGTVLCWL